MRKKMMALLLAIMCVFSMSVFTACGGSTEEVEETSVYPMTVEDNDYFSFTIKEYDDTWEEYSYTIENKSDRNVTFDVESVIANDEYTLDTFIFSEVSAGTKANDTFIIDSDDLDQFEDGDTITLTIKYRLYDSDTFDDITTGSFSFDITK